MLRNCGTFFKNKVGDFAGKFRKMDLGIPTQIAQTPKRSEQPKRETFDWSGYVFNPKSGLWSKTTVISVRPINKKDKRNELPVDFDPPKP